MKLGDDVVALRTLVETGERDDYGNPIRRKVDVLVQWCSVTPTVSLEAIDRTSPAISGCRWLAPPTVSGVTPEDQVVWPVGSRNQDGTYQGPVWEVVGEVGLWDWGFEVQLRREE